MGISWDIHSIFLRSNFDLTIKHWIFMLYQWIYFGRCRDLTGPMVECNGINHPLDVCLKIGDTIGYPIEKSHLIHRFIGDTTFSDKPKDWLVIVFCHIRDADTQWLLSDYYISRRVETTPTRKMIRLDVLVQKFHSKQLMCVSSGEFDQQQKKKTSLLIQRKMGPTPTEMDLAPAKVRIVLGNQKMIGMGIIPRSDFRLVKSCNLPRLTIRYLLKYINPYCRLIKPSMIQIHDIDDWLTIIQYHLPEL